VAYPSGTFNKPFSGKLQVTFSGKLRSYPSGGSPGWGLDSNAKLRILCTAGALETIITLESPSNVLEMDYTAGTNVSVSMALQSWSYSGLGGVEGAELRIRCILMKR